MEANAKLEEINALRLAFAGGTCSGTSSQQDASRSRAVTAPSGCLRQRLGLLHLERREIELVLLRED